MIFDDVSAAYVGASVTWSGLLVSGVGMVGLVFGSTAGIILARMGARPVMIVVLGIGVWAQTRPSVCRQIFRRFLSVVVGSRHVERAFWYFIH